MPLILHIETATEVCSVCLSEGGEVLVLRESAAPYAHARDITLLIDDCFKAIGMGLKDLDAISVSRGPGSYTSLRVGAATAKGICYALRKPIILVDTLQSIAEATYRKEGEEALYCPMIDARRMEVYCALYEPSGNVVVPVTTMVIDSHAFGNYFAVGKRIIFSGNGAGKCRSFLTAANARFSDVVCSAANLVKPAEEAFHNKRFADAAYFTPFYMKAPQITVTKNKAFMSA